MSLSLSLSLSISLPPYSPLFSNYSLLVYFFPRGHGSSYSTSTSILCLHTNLIIIRGLCPLVPL